MTVGVGGRGDVLAGVALVGRDRVLGALTEGNEALGVRDAGGGADHDGHIELLGKIVGSLHEVQAFLGIGGLEHSDLGSLGIVAVVLLVLGGVHTRVVGGDDDHAAADAVVGSGEDGVGGDVDADVLHGAKAADAGDACAVGDFRCDLFVRGPLAVQGILVLGQVLKNLGAGGAGIRRANLDAGLIGASGNGFIAGKQFSIQLNDHLSCFWGLDVGRFWHCLQENYKIRLANCKD